MEETYLFRTTTYLQRTLQKLLLCMKMTSQDHSQLLTRTSATPTGSTPGPWWLRPPWVPMTRWGKTNQIICLLLLQVQVVNMVTSAIEKYKWRAAEISRCVKVGTVHTMALTQLTRRSTLFVIVFFWSGLAPS